MPDRTPTTSNMDTSAEAAQEDWVVEVLATSTCRFAILSVLLAHRVLRTWGFGSGSHTPPTTFKAELAFALLLLLHGIVRWTISDQAEHEIIGGVLGASVWLVCTGVLLIEHVRRLGRSSELKVFFLIDAAFKLIALKKAVLDFCQSDTIGATAELAWNTSSTVISIALATAALFETSSVKIASASYGTIHDDKIEGCEKTEVLVVKPSWASLLSFSWINKILFSAYTGRISEDDLRDLEPTARSAAKRDELLLAWREETSRRPHDAQLWKAMAKVFTLDFAFAASFRLLSMLFSLAGPLLLQKLVQEIEGIHIEKNDDDIDEQDRRFEIARIDGVMIAIAIGLSKVIGTLFQEQWVARFIATNAQIRGALTGMIFRKGFLLSAKGRKEYKIGELISLMSVDASRIGHSMYGLHMLWSAPIMVVAAVALLYSMVGSSIFVGIIVALVLLPFNVWVARLQGKLNKQVMKVKDERSNLMDEVLQGVRIIKYFAWEQNFEDKVKEIRAREVALIFKISLCTAYMVTVSSGTTMLIAVVTFASYAWTGANLTPSVAFGALALFKLMDHPLTMLGHLVDIIVEGKTALGRLRDFFLADELDRGYYDDGDDGVLADDKVELTRTNCDGMAIKVTNGTFSWPRHDDVDKDDDDGSSKSLLSSFSNMFTSSRSVEMTEMDGKIDMEEVLRGVNWAVLPGELCMITGAVGAGKTSLLSAVLGDVCKEEGSVVLSGKVAYAPQQPWIFNATVQDNILFGAELDQARYDMVLEVCALKHDMHILPAGDQTEIGEKGVNLSGGQKARISLARCVYRQADVYLLDDPLSAVDVHVSKTIFDDCIRTFLKGTTRVLVTHQVQYVTKADTVVNLDRGVITAQGAASVVIAQCSQLAEAVSVVRKAEAGDEEGDDERRGSEDSSADTQKEVARSSARPDSTAASISPGDGVQTKEEELLEDAVDAQIWRQYVMKLGCCVLSSYFVLLMARELMGLAIGWWLSTWSTATSEPEDVEVDDIGAESDDGLSTLHYISVLAMINLIKNVGSAALVLLERSAGLKAGVALHDEMLATVLRAPVEFFDTTPSGRVLNRFTSDMHALDRDVAARLASFVGRTVEAAMLCVAIAVVNPLVLVITVPAIALFVSIQRLFKRGCLQLQRLESIHKSPLFAHFSESLNGVSTIRAFSAVPDAMETSCKLTDNLARAWTNLIDCHQWLTVRVTLLASLIILTTSVTAVLRASPSAASAAATGLVITYAFQLIDVLSETVRAFTNTEQALVSVERVSEYGAMSREEDAQAVVRPPPNAWPTEGRLEFEEVVMTYRKAIPPALKGMSFATKPGEKIGVVGRTGAGKSSLAVCLFRLGHITSGKITLDGVDTLSVGLEALRVQLSIIPQDPVVFSGTIRSNLDPFHAHGDNEIWEALACVHLKELVSGFRSGLDHRVAQGGSNLSVGQRQLFCLARALLRKAKVIVMDEATASVDQQTDGLIQDAIRTHFQTSTVLTIAHRLNTAMSCDRVLVLGDGRSLEMGPPAQLALDPASVFHQMVADPARQSWRCSMSGF